MYGSASARTKDEEGGIVEKRKSDAVFEDGGRMFSELSSKTFEMVREQP